MKLDTLQIAQLEETIIPNVKAESKVHGQQKEHLEHDAYMDNKPSQG